MRIDNLGKYGGKGWHHSLETKKKMSLTRKGRSIHPGTLKNLIGRPASQKVKEKVGAIWRGKKIPQSARDNMRIAHLNFLKSCSLKGPTSIEKKLYNELKKRGLLFEEQKLINGKFLVDAYVPFLNLVIEADGDFWHSLDRVKKKDKAENAYLAKCGYKLLRLSEKEINDGSFINLLN